MKGGTEWLQQTHSCWVHVPRQAVAHWSLVVSQMLSTDLLPMLPC